jgi:hypothetical protein
MRLSDEVLSKILNLQQQLLLLIDRAKAAEYLIIENCRSSTHSKY